MTHLVQTWTDSVPTQCILLMAIHMISNMVRTRKWARQAWHSCRGSTGLPSCKWLWPFRLKGYHHHWHQHDQILRFISLKAKQWNWLQKKATIQEFLWLEITCIDHVGTVFALFAFCCYYCFPSVFSLHRSNYSWIGADLMLWTTEG